MEKYPRPTRAWLFNNNYSYVCEEDPDGFHIITRHHIIAKRKWMPEFLAWSTCIGLMAFICTLLSPIPTVSISCIILYLCDCFIQTNFISLSLQRWKYDDGKIWNSILPWLHTFKVFSIIMFWV